MVGIESRQNRVAAPRVPERTPPFRFPFIATIAPVAAALVLWLLTNSPFALLFAALGPVTALAGLADSRFGSRRTERRELRRFEADAATARERIASAHTAERLAMQDVTPGARVILARSGADPYRWRVADGDAVQVCVGSGSVPSSLTFERAPDGPHPPPVARLLADLEERAATLEAAPVVVDARLGIGIVGPPVLAAAVARAVALQLAWSLSPERHWWACASSTQLGWLELLAHRSAPASGRTGEIEFGMLGATRPLVTVGVAGSESELPVSCGIVILLGSGTAAAITQHPDRAQRRSIRVEPISTDEAAAWAAAAAREAERGGLVVARRLPAVVALEGLLAASPGTDPASLACAPAVDDSGPVLLDLVTDGPHAVIGGTTGSGKSELLVSWILSMAAVRGPELVTFLLVDFKGGAAFAELARLPHTVGIITDLDETQARRALESLRAELRFRERTLAAAGARELGEATALPRLVIVVDEFATLLSDHPDLHSLFADVAARGRSLGVHLVLCTQRPAGVVRDAILANADLRISLRVNNRADSVAVVGTADAAEISAEARGRAVISLAGGSPRAVQFGLAAAADVDAVAERWSGSPPVRRPWCEPLPPSVPLAELAPLDELAPLAEPPGTLPGIPFGLLDLTSEQRREVARFDPARDGHLLVLGAAGSGKSGALDVIAAMAPGSTRQSIRLPTAVDAAWDLLADLGGALEAGGPPERLLLVDDIDSLLSRFPPDHRVVVAERLAGLLRDGPGRGIRVVLAAQRLTADVQALAGLVPSRLMLRHASRQDHVLGGGDGARYIDGLPPGGGLWQGHRVQVASGAPVAGPAPLARVTEWDRSRPVALVSTRARSLVPRLRQAGGSVFELAELAGDLGELVRTRARPVILVGDVEDWQSRWGALAALRPLAEILFDGCSVADFRALTRSRELPPPISGPRRLCWRLNEDGSASRAPLPLVPD